MRLSKRFKEILKDVDTNKEYTVEEAVDVLKNNSKVKFDETVELTVQLNVNPTKQDQNVRGVMLLPHGTGKKKRICVVAKVRNIKKQKELKE